MSVERQRWLFESLVYSRILSVTGPAVTLRDGVVESLMTTSTLKSPALFGVKEKSGPVVV